MHRHYWRDPDTGQWAEITGRIDRVGWEVTSKAEEGATPIATIGIDDPAMDFDIVGHRRYIIVEDESEAADTVLWAGYTADQVIGRSAGDALQPLARTWTVSVSDENTVWQRRVMRGADCKRPAETDVERMTWLLSTAEASMFDDVTTYVSAADPEDMDACDYRNQMFNGIADDCAQQSGKNWFATRIGSGTSAELFAWYGADAETDYSSPLSLSNDPDDWTDAELAAGTSLCWPISMDTKLARDPSRIFSGVVVPYDGGNAYVESSATAAAFARRDTSMPSVNVKTKTKAERRGRRYLRDLDEQDERITTTVEVPAALATQLKAGMRIEFKATHLPGLSAFTWCRILSAAPTPIAAGERYRIALELAVPAGAGDSGSPPGAAAYAILHQGFGPYGGAVHYAGTGDLPPPGYPYRPTVGLITPMTGGTTRTPYTGLRVDGDGTVDVVFHATTTGVYTFTRTIEYSIRLNGGAVSTSIVSKTRNDHPGYWADSATLTASGLAVSSGDVISASTAVVQGPIHFFRTPQGVGDREERLEITGGSLS